MTMRMMLNLCRIAALWCVASAALSQNAQRTFISFTQHDNALEVQTSDGVYLIKPYSNQIVETTFVPNAEQGNEQVRGSSDAVVMQPQTINVTLQDSGDRLTYQTPGIQVSIAKSPFTISYAYCGRPLISEKRGYSRDARGDTLEFNLDASEALYGAGARALGMNRRGNRLPLYNKAHYGYETHSEQMNFSIPLVYSSAMYGILFDNAPIGYLDLDSKHDNTLTYETIGGRKTYQVFAGNNWEELIGAYTSLTGHQSLPPRWAFGNFASRFGYHSAKEAKGIVDQFLADQIPLDAIIFDLYWFGKDVKGTLGNLEFDHDNFPDPQGMIKDFAAEGVKTVLITEPFILTTSSKWNEAVQKKILATHFDGTPYAYEFYFGNTGLIDLFKPEAREWFWNVYKKYTQWGVAGWWGDLGEPEVHPADLQHVNGSADQVHNIYGHSWAKLIADGYRKDFPEQRPFILMRSGYAGSQRFGMIPWSGDVNRTWGGLQSQPEIALQMGMQGMGYMHSDLGGFAGANLDNELYVRWLQYGVFQPIFRPHAQEEVASEAVLKDAPTKQLAKAAIELRYKMLPYNYTLAFDNAQKGLPLMRPLFFSEPQNRALYSVADSYLWGSDFLVKPVLQAGVQAMSVYFPANANWSDLNSDRQYAAGSTQTVPVVADHIPVFVRNGAFIPMIDLIQNTEKYSTKTFNLHYYYDDSVKVASGKLYDDDGKTPDVYEREQYSILYFGSSLVTEKRHQHLVITINPVNAAHSAGIDRTVSLFVHHIISRPTGARLQSGVKSDVVKFTWDSATHIVAVAVPLNKATPVKLQLDLAGTVTRSAANPAANVGQPDKK